MKKIIFLISLLVSSHTFSEKIFACSCYATPPISVELESSKAVFTGKVIGYRDIEVTEADEDSKGNTRLLKSTNRVYKLRAIEIFKGDKSRKEFDIDAGSIGSSCFREFTIGDDFLIYASGDDEKLYGYLVCGLTTYLQENDGQLSFIKELLSGKPEPQIYGNYEEFQTDNRTGKYKKRPKEGSTIVIENETDKFETITDENGLYRFNNIPSGKYTLKPINIPTGQKTFETIIRISEDGKVAEEMSDFGGGAYSSQYISLGTHWGNRVQGNVTDSEGTKLDFASIKLLPADSPDEKIDSVDFFAKAHDGKYFSGNKSPGKYVLAMQVYMPSGNGSFVRFFYPGVKSSADAEIIKLDAKTELDLNVKIPLALRQVRGIATWDDNTPIKGETILLLSKDREIQKKLLDLKKSSFDLEYAEDNGEFVLEGFEDAEYWLHAIVTVESENENEDMSVYRSKPMKIKLGKANDLLKLKISRAEKSESIF